MEHQLKLVDIIADFLSGLVTLTAALIAVLVSFAGRAFPRPRLKALLAIALGAYGVSVTLAAYAQWTFASWYSLWTNSRVGENTELIDKLFDKLNLVTSAAWILFAVGTGTLVVYGIINLLAKTDESESVSLD